MRFKVVKKSNGKYQTFDLYTCQTWTFHTEVEATTKANYLQKLWDDLEPERQARKQYERDIVKQAIKFNNSRTKV